ncbi:MAG: 2OG-Fe(II) oxygenase [Crocinitomicaceae bacterium]|nr:2OG-Fe(II) oxygenase [Crocinitomicaceae bacterium]
MNKKVITEEIFEIENFLTPIECDEFLDRFENETFEEAKVNIDGNQIMRKSIRNNDRILFFDNNLAEEMWSKVSSFVPEELGLYKSIGLNEMFRVYKYSAGQRFKMHMDGSYKRNEREQSFYSFLIYLNEDFSGGETEFRKLGIVEPKKGNALVFRHHNRHEGKEVKSGKKYVLRTDIMFKIKE